MGVEDPLEGTSNSTAFSGNGDEATEPLELSGREREGGREGERERDRQTDREKERETHTHTHTQMEMER